MMVMNKKESNQWSAEEDKSLKKTKQSMIDSLKGTEYDVLMDKIVTVQDRLYLTLSYLPVCRSLFLKKTENEETTEMDPRIQGVVEAVHDQIIWEKVYGKTDNGSLPIETKGAKPVQEIRQSVIDSLKGIQFDIIRDDYTTVDEKLSSTLRYLYEWRRLLPEKARPIMAWAEWNSKMVNDVSLKALGDTVSNSGRLRGFIDSL